MRATRIIITLAALALLLLPLKAGAAGVFDNLILSPRARAMGGAFVALSDDETAIFTNPAALGGQDKYKLYASYVDLYGYDFINLGSFAASIPVGTKGTIGVGSRLFSTEYKGVDLESEFTLTVGHGFTVMKDVHSSLAFGYALNFYGLSFEAQSLSGEDLGSDTAFGLDVGVLGTLRGRTRFGFFAKNINNPTMGDPDAKDLPQWFSAGVAYSPYGGVQTVLEMQKQEDEDLRTCFGLEFGITDYLTLRGGIQNQPDRLSAGFGTHWQSIRIDYSYTSHETLPGSHNFGLGYTF